MKEKFEILINEIQKNRIAKKGMELSPIYEEVLVYNNCNEYKEPQFRCFQDAEGRSLKGAVICSKTIKNDESDYGWSSEDRELFLMEDGTLKVFIRKVTRSNLLDQESRDIREVASDEEMSCFDYYEVIDNISKELEKRLQKLGTRTKAQTARMQKLEKLKIVS